jgi:nondiscriminating glutamyl-tRNA synthetase
MRVRFAPSPTGQLHVGNARTALFNALLARGQRGTFILRIEDTDIERSTKESERAIIEDLRWMGLDWSEGVEAGGEHGPYRQSERLHLYRAHAAELLSRGHAYHCFCSEEQLEADRQTALNEGRPPKYVGRCRAIERDEARRRIEHGEHAVIRLRVEEGRDVVFKDVVRGEVRFNTDVIDDPVLVRSDGHPAYNFAVVIDDALMQVTHVVRGEDHISNTPRQILLYEAFGWTPPVFAHVSLVMGPTTAHSRRGMAPPR